MKSNEKLVEYVQRSTYRIKVIKSLDNEVKIPSKIARDSEIRQNHISKVLAELKKRELIECINPEVKRGRLYRLTNTGVQIVKNLK